MSHTENHCLIMEMGKSVLGVGEGGRVLMTSVDKELQSQGSPPLLGGISRLSISCLCFTRSSDELSEVEQPPPWI